MFRDPAGDHDKYIDEEVMKYLSALVTVSSMSGYGTPMLEIPLASYCEVRDMSLSVEKRHFAGIYQEKPVKMSDFYEKRRFFP